MLARSWRDTVAFFLPGMLMLFSTMIALSPAPFESLPFYPHSYLLCVCIFTLYAPYVLPLPFVFFAGLLADVVYAAPFGVHGVCGIMLQYAVLKMREPFISAPFLFIWGGMSVLVSLFLLILWALSRWVAQTDVPLSSMSWLWAGSVICYPIWHSLGLRILRLLPSR